MVIQMLLLLPAGSDRRLKENITNYTGGYDKIKSIPVKQWDEKYSSKKKR